MVKRQRTAFPPNFVHSLDGSHMMMTAIACKEAGLSFAGLYCCLFSFWLHEMSSAHVNKRQRYMLTFSFQYWWQECMIHTGHMHLMLTK